MNEYVLISNSPGTTLNLGRKLGINLQPGSIIALTGELGSGKTLFTRGICAGLAVPNKYVNSPTFILVNEYRGKYPVFHMDLYRLENAADGFEIGILDYLERADNGIIVIEWAERILSLLSDSYLQVEFRVLSARKRQLILTGTDEKYSRLLGEIGG